MNIRKILVLALVAFTVQSAVADLLVLRSGGTARSALLRFRDRTPQFLGAMTADTEGFYGATLGPDGAIYAAANTLGYGDVYRFNRNGELLGRFAGQNLRTPGNLTFGPDGNLYVISSTWPESPQQAQVLRYNGATGAFMDVFVSGAGSGGAAWLADLDFGPDGNLYACDPQQGILRYNGSTGAFEGIFVPNGRGGLSGPSAFAFGPDGNLCVCSRESNAVLKFSGRTGALLRVLVPAGRGGLRGPAGIALGRGGYLYISSSLNNRVLRYNARTGQFVDAFIAAHPQVINPGKLLFVPAAAAGK